MATSVGYDTMRSGKTILFYVNRDGLPLSERCNERMWNFCKEQYQENTNDIEKLRNQTNNYPPVAYVEPPYHIASSSRLKVHEKLQLIENYIQKLEYNYTGMQFFDLNAARPLCGLMDTARHIMTESLPIKCFEAFLIALYLTTGIIGLDRFNISFKTRFNSTIYRHVILGVKYGQSFGSLGLSRRCDLAYKPLNNKYDRLSTLINDFVIAYQNYGHKILRIRIGLPIIHDLKSFLTINWTALVIQPTKTDRSEYDRELDKIVRIWRELDVHMTYRTVVPLASVIQPTGQLITTASITRKVDQCRRSAKKKIQDETTIDNDQSKSYVIRV